MPWDAIIVCSAIATGVGVLIMAGTFLLGPRIVDWAQRELEQADDAIGAGSEAL